MATTAGKDGKVTLAPVAWDAEGRPVGNGPGGGANLGQVVRWRLRHRQELVSSAVMGEEYRSHEGGLREWSADVELLWDAAAHGELWECVLEGDFAGSFADKGRIELTLFTDGESSVGKRAYYGAAILRKATVLTARDDLVRLRTEFFGVGGLDYRTGLFGAGTFGAMCGYRFQELGGYTFTAIQSLAEK